VVSVPVSNASAQSRLFLSISKLWKRHPLGVPSECCSFLLYGHEKKHSLLLLAEQTHPALLLRLLLRLRLFDDRSGSLHSGLRARRQLAVFDSDAPSVREIGPRFTRAGDGAHGADARCARVSAELGVLHVADCVAFGAAFVGFGWRGF